jgi:cytosine/adenosine deaminase-related metal-dependent hydrolase
MNMARSSQTRLRLLTNATIVTVNKSREIILDGAILVENGRITALGKTSDIIDQVNQNENKDLDIVDCKNKIIIPGLVNTHAHLAQSLLRGLAEDLPLHNWLCDAIWPLEANYAEDDGYVASMLTIAEMLKTGTTCFLEAMLTHRSGLENVVRAVEETGVRACLVSVAKHHQCDELT